jgi:hypothetical protein
MVSPGLAIMPSAMESACWPPCVMKICSASDVTPSDASQPTMASRCWRRPLMRQIAEQIRHFAGGDDIADRRCNQVVLAGVGRHIEREVDGGVRRAERGALFRPAALNEGASGTDLSRDQAALVGAGIGLSTPFRTLRPRRLRHYALGQMPHSRLDAAGATSASSCNTKARVARAQDRLRGQVTTVGSSRSISYTRISRLSVGKQDSTYIHIGCKH